MERVLMKLVSMSLSAGWLVLAVIAIRAALHRSPRRIVCLLWALVAVRLLCPFSIESRVSLVPRAETVVQSAQQAIPVETAPQPEHAAESSPVTALSRVWLAGAAAMLLWAAWSNLRVCRRVRVSLPQGERIRVCDEIETPFVLGVFRPRIYLPSRLNPEQTVYVLAHENAHIARRDHWWKPLGWLLLSVYWFHPLLWLAYVLFCRDLELACDERVAKGLDRSGLAAYSETLLRCSRVRRGDLAMPIAFGEVGVKTRVRAILRYRRPGRRIVAASLAAVLAVGVLFLTDRPVLAAQLPDLLREVNEDAWTVPLEDYADAGAALPQPSPSPTPIPAQSVQFAQSQTSSEAQEVSTSIVIPTPTINSDMPPVYGTQQNTLTTDQRQFTQPSDTLPPAPSIRPLIAGTDSTGIPGHHVGDP